MESDFWQRRLATVTGQPDRAAAITAEIAVLFASTLAGLVEMVREQVTPDVVAGPAHPEVTALAGRHRDVVPHEATGPAFASLDELTAAGMLTPSVLRGAGYEPADVLAACAAAAEALV